MGLLGFITGKDKKNAKNKTKKEAPKKTVEDYNIRRVEVMTTDGYLLLLARIAVAPDGHIELHQFADTECFIPGDVVSMRVLVRGFDETHQKAVHMEGNITALDYRVWTLTGVEISEGENDRAFFRQSTTLPGTIQPVPPLLDEGEDEDWDGEADLSEDGSDSDGGGADTTDFRAGAMPEPGVPFSSQVTLSSNQQVLSANQSADYSTQNADDSGQDIPEEEPVECTVLNVSAGGACVQCKKEMMAEDELILTVTLTPGNTLQQRCRICRAAKRRGNVYEYGCQFMGLDPAREDEISRSIIALQMRRMNTKR